MLVMFLNESGDHDLTRLDDPSRAVFVLGGVIVDSAYARTVLEPRVRALKQSFFGREDLVLHTADMVRARSGFESLAAEEARAAFVEQLNALMAELEYRVLACVVRKPEILERGDASAVDVYREALGVLVERFCDELGNSVDNGLIVAEKRRPDLDRALPRA